MSTQPSAPPLIGKLVIIGVGLIGGSFAAALREAGQVGRIVGVGRNQDNLQTALDMGLIDSIALQAADAVRDADFVLLGMPVGQMPGVMAAIAPHLPDHCVVSDAGSTKSDVLAHARVHMGARLGQFVPAHPIAGAEHSGAAAARADLYRGKTIVVCAQAETQAAAVDLVNQAWSFCGGVVQNMDVATHDRVFAAVSHLPHVLAFALVDDIAGRSNASQLFGFAASGFRDFTRIASSHPEMWRDICLANREAVLFELDAYQQQLQRLRGLLEAEDGDALEAVFLRARTARDQWIAEREARSRAE